jgi:hypothetical protein
LNMVRLRFRGGTILTKKEIAMRSKYPSVMLICPSDLSLALLLQQLWREMGRLKTIATLIVAVLFSFGVVSLVNAQAASPNANQSQKQTTSPSANKPSTNQSKPPVASPPQRQAPAANSNPYAPGNASGGSANPYALKTSPNPPQPSAHVNGRNGNPGTNPAQEKPCPAGQACAGSLGVIELQQQQKTQQQPK